MRKALSRFDGENALVVLGGDLVNRADSEAEWTAFFEVVDRIRAEYDVTFVSANGNFSSQGGYENRADFRSRFLLPGNGPYGCEDRFYSFDRGCAHFIVLDSHMMGDPDENAYKYIGAWIKHDLAKNTRPAVFAVMHHPAYTLGTSFDDDIRGALIRKNYMKLLYRYGVDLILCGHQHVYCRTGADAQITQIMGVSGTKFFSSKDEKYMSYIAENVGAATLIRANPCTIKAETCDSAGHLIDELTQDVRWPKPRKCGSCVNFSRCGGTGIVELEEMQAKAKREGLPWERAYTGGLLVDGRQYTDQQLRDLPHVSQKFSLWRRNRQEHEQIEGIKLTALVPDAKAILAISDDGDRRAFRMSDIKTAYCFGQNSEPEAVDAVIYEENGPGSRYRLAFGQREDHQYNGRQWIRHISEIRTFDPDEWLRY